MIGEGHGPVAHPLDSPLVTESLKVGIFQDTV